MRRSAAIHYRSVTRAVPLSFRLPRLPRPFPSLRKPVGCGPSITRNGTGSYRHGETQPQRGQYLLRSTRLRPGADPEPRLFGHRTDVEGPDRAAVEDAHAD